MHSINQSHLNNKNTTISQSQSKNKSFKLDPYVAQHFLDYLTDKEMGRLILTNKFWFAQKKGFKFWSKIIDYHGIFERAITWPNASLTKKTRNLLLELPSGIDRYFLKFCTVNETTRLSSINRQWKTITEDNEVWLRIAQRFPETEYVSKETEIKEPKKIVQNLFDVSKKLYNKTMQIAFDGIENILLLPRSISDINLLGSWAFHQKPGLIDLFSNKPTIFRAFHYNFPIIMIQVEVTSSLFSSDQYSVKVPGILTLSTYKEGIYGIASQSYKTEIDRIGLMCHCGIDLYIQEKDTYWIKNLVNGVECGKKTFTFSSEDEIWGHYIENANQTYKLRETKNQ